MQEKDSRVRRLLEKTGWTRKNFKDRLKEETGLDIHLRTISRWKSGGKIQATYRETVKKFLDKVEEAF